MSPTLRVIFSRRSRPCLSLQPLDYFPVTFPQLFSGSEPNLHGCCRSLRATGSELDFRQLGERRGKPLGSLPLTQKAESVHSRLPLFTG
jgi:hypothetical protein